MSHLIMGDGWGRKQTYFLSFLEPMRLRCRSNGLMVERVGSFKLSGAGRQCWMHDARELIVKVDFQYHIMIVSS